MERIEVRAGILPTILLSLLAIVLLLGACMMPPAGAIITGLGAVASMFGAVALAKRRLWLDDEGVTSTGLLGIRHIAWNEVEHYTFWSMEQTRAMAIGAGAQGGLIGIAVAAIVIGIVSSRRRATGQLVRPFSMGRLTIVSRDRRRIPIDTRYRHVAPVLERAFQELHDRLRAGYRRDYLPFTLGDQNLVHARKGTLALAEIEKISVRGARVVVKKRGKRLAWASARMRDVTNGLLLLEDLAERGIVVQTSAGMFVPPSILQKLLAAASRQAALPQARVVKQ